MAKRSPRFVALDHDDHYARHVGRAADGSQFFLTTPFVSASASASAESPGHEFGALYRFDSAGTLVEARIGRHPLRTPRPWPSPPTAKPRPAATASAWASRR